MKAESKGCLTLTAHEAAKRLGVSENHLAKMRCQGRGPTFVRLGAGTIRYTDADLQAYLDERRVRPGSAA